MYGDVINIHPGNFLLITLQFCSRVQAIKPSTFIFEANDKFCNLQIIKNF
jgi:hypothetical protein